MNNQFATDIQLSDECKKILNLNLREGGFTVPTAKLYPFQWLWDSGFIAIGWAHFNLEQAINEIEALFSAQWANGFLPHIVFHSINESKVYYPGPDVHGAHLNPNHPKHIQTTGITQPPIIGFVVEIIYKIAKSKQQLPLFSSFFNDIFDKCYAFHQYLFQNRDPHQEGLVYIQHNWESGTDNSPVWDEIWATFDAPHYDLPRRDIQHINADQRPTQRDYEYYIYLLEIFKSVQYEDAQIAKISPFLVQDPLFNSMLIASNDALARLGKVIGANQEKINQLKQWSKKGKSAMNSKLWSKVRNCYLHYDLRNNRAIDAITSSSFSPIFAKIPTKKRALILKNLLESDAYIGNKQENYLFPSFNTTDARYNPKKYWRGPVWINLNWLIYNGLKKYEFYELANEIKSDSLELVRRYGMYEYFHPLKNIKNEKGYGAEDFSWSAALILDFLNEKQ